MPWVKGHCQRQHKSCLQTLDTYLAPQKLQELRRGRMEDITPHAFLRAFCQSLPRFLNSCNKTIADNPAAGLELIPSQSHTVFKCAQRGEVGLEKKKIQLVAFGDRCSLPPPNPRGYSAALWELKSHFDAAKWGNTTYCRQVERIKHLNFANMKMMPIKILLPFSRATAENKTFSVPLWRKEEIILRKILLWM